MAQKESAFLNFKGISGPIYRLDEATDTPLRDDSNALVVLDASGFYRVELKNFDEIRKTTTIIITPFQSKKKFIKNPNNPVYKNKIVYNVNNNDEVVDELNEVTTVGTFDTWFGKSVIRANNTCESDKARAFILSLNGTHPCQATFPIDFTIMSQDNITQTNINNALA